MAKICFPHYKKGEFASLADALKFMNRETYSVSRYALCEIDNTTPATVTTYAVTVWRI